MFLRLRYDGHKVLRAKVLQKMLLKKIISTLFSGGGCSPSICPTSAQWNWLLRLLDRGQENVSRVFRISRDFQDFVKWNLADVWYKKKFFKDIYKRIFRQFLGGQLTSGHRQSWLSSWEFGWKSTGSPGPSWLRMSVSSWRPRRWSLMPPVCNVTSDVWFV